MVASDYRFDLTEPALAFDRRRAPLFDSFSASFPFSCSFFTALGVFGLNYALIKLV
jgi:hypothetical protein